MQDRLVQQEGKHLMKPKSFVSVENVILYGLIKQDLDFGLQRNHCFYCEAVQSAVLFSKILFKTE